MQPWVSHPLKHPCLHADTHSVSHSPSGVWLSMALSVWLRMSLTSSPVPTPTVPPTHRHTHTQSYPCFPSVTLYTADSSVACQKWWSLIATIRWDGPRSIGLRMTALNCGAGGGWGSCFGTVLPLWGPADSKISSRTVHTEPLDHWLIHPTQFTLWTVNWLNWRAFVNGVF